jgi:Uma2 family endonuclease
VSTQPKTLITPEQYLEIERKAEYRSEYYQGEMFPMGGEVLAMAGASIAHNRVVGNLFATLHQQLRSRPCSVFSTDTRVFVAATGLYTYPDVVAVCGELQVLDARKDTLLNPSVLAEVHSPSTEAYDRGRKFEQYQSIESFKEYLLIASDRMHVDRYTRQVDGLWLLASASLPCDSLELPSIGCRITLADLYEKVNLAETAAPLP